MKDSKYGGNYVYNFSLWHSFLLEEYEKEFCIKYIILVYDILSDENGARISRNIFKICKKYLTNVQKSVFEGEITPVLLKKLNIELGKFIRKDKDSLIIFKSRQEKWLEKEFWGIEDDKTSNFF